MCPGGYCQDCAIYLEWRAWRDTEQLHSLAQLKLKLAHDALDDCQMELEDCLTHLCEARRLKGELHNFVASSREEDRHAKG